MERIPQLNKTPVVNKKVLNRIMLYTEMDLKDDEFFTKHLKTLSFGKEKKKPQAKMEKALNN